MSSMVETYVNGVEQAQKVIFRLPLGRHMVITGRKIMKLSTHIIFRNPIVTNGYKLCWDNSVTFGDLLVFKTAKYEVETFSLLQRLTKEGMCVMDIGANRGYYTMFFAKTVGSKGKIYAIEPQKCNQALIEKSAKFNKFNNIQIIPYALSDKIGEALFYVEYEGIGSGSLFKEREVRMQYPSKVNTITLDAYFKNEGWPKVDLIKMDIEGSEIMAMAGGKEFFKRNQQVKLVIEFCPTVLRRVGFTCEQFFRSLLELGFNRFYLTRGGLVEIDIPNGIGKLVDSIPITGFENIYCYKE